MNAALERMDDQLSSLRSHFDQYEEESARTVNTFIEIKEQAEEQVKRAKEGVVSE